MLVGQVFVTVFTILSGFVARSSVLPVRLLDKSEMLDMSNGTTGRNRSAQDSVTDNLQQLNNGKTDGRAHDGANNGKTDGGPRDGVMNDESVFPASGYEILPVTSKNNSSHPQNATSGSMESFQTFPVNSQRQPDQTPKSRDKPPTRPQFARKIGPVRLAAPVFNDVSEHKRPSVQSVRRFLGATRIHINVPGAKTKGVPTIQHQNPEMAVTDHVGHIMNSDNGDPSVQKHTIDNLHNLDSDNASISANESSLVVPHSPLFIALTSKRFSWVDIVVSVCSTSVVVIAVFNIIVCCNYCTKHHKKPRPHPHCPRPMPDLNGGGRPPIQRINIESVNKRNISAEKRCKKTASCRSHSGRDVSTMSLISVGTQYDCIDAMLASFVDDELIVELNDRDSTLTSISNGFTFSREYGTPQSLNDGATEL